MRDWTLLSNHGHVLVCLARDNEARLRSVAADVGITERAVQKIVRELQQGGFISISKQGRRNRYTINTRKCLRHALETRCTVGRLLQLFSFAEKRGAPVTGGEGTRAKSAQSGRARSHSEQPSRSGQGASSPSKQPDAAGDGKARSSAGEKAATSGQPLDSRQQGSLF